MRGRHSIGSASRPTVVEQNDRFGARVDHRLDCQCHAGFEFWPATAPAVVRDLRFFVQFAADAVTDEFAHDCETISPRFVLDLRADVTETAAGVRHSYRAVECCLRRPQQALGAIVHHADGNGRSVVPYPTGLNDADVELDDIAVLNAPVAANPVNDLVVHRNANVSGENAVPEVVAKKCAFHFRLLHKISGRFVDFLCRDSWAYEFPYTIENVTGRATRLPHLIRFA